MLEKLGNKNFSLLTKMLDLHAAKQKVVAQNIANVNTPNYRRREFQFDNSLKEALRKGNSSAYQQIQGWVDRPNNTPIRNNGNNVDIDMEMVTMQENANLYQIYSTLYTRKSQFVKSIIKGVR